MKVRFHGMLEEYCIFLKNLSFHSFSRLMEPTRCTKSRENDLEAQVHKSSKSYDQATIEKKAYCCNSLEGLGSKVFTLEEDLL